MTKPEEIWGNKFNAKLKTMIAKGYRDRTQVSPAMRREIIGLVRTTFDGEKVSLQYPRNNITFDVVLAQAPKDMRPRQFPSKDYSLGMQWKGTWISAILNQEQMMRIKPAEFYVLVGFLKLKGQYRNFYVRDIITLDQIKDTGIELRDTDTQKTEGEPEEAEDIPTRDATPEPVK